MTRRLAYAFLLIFMFLGVSTLSAQEPAARTGFALMPTGFGPGLGIRSWTSDSFGWGLEGETDWRFNDFLGRGRLMMRTSQSQNGKTYLLVTAGIASIRDSASIEGAAYAFKMSFPSGAVGLGYETRKGWAFEIGYQIGKANYEINYEFMGEVFSYTGTYKMPPLYLGLSYTMYF